jgi:hypothetical protein
VAVSFNDVAVCVRYCEHIGVDPDEHLLKAEPAHFETWIDRILRTTKKTHETICQILMEVGVPELQHLG